MNYQPGGRFTIGRGIALAVWTLFITIMASAMLFLFTFGDCFSEKACKVNKNQASIIILVITFIIYWAGFLALIRKWSSK